MKTRLEKRSLKNRKRLIGKYPQVACFAFDRISTTINVRGLYNEDELNFLAKNVFARLAQRRVCLDVGANIGNHSLFFADYFNEVAAIEPNPRTFRLLELNAELRDNITPVSIGASDCRQVVRAYEDPMNIGATTVEADVADQRVRNQMARNKPHDKRQITMTLDRLDEVVPQSMIGHVDFMKIDVEGHELPALRGARNIILESRPVICFEAFPQCFVSGTSEVIEFLRSLGYVRFYQLQDAGLVAKLPGALQNLLALMPYVPCKRFALVKRHSFVSQFYPMILALPASSAIGRG